MLVRAVVGLADHLRSQRSEPASNEKEGKDVREVIGVINGQEFALGPLTEVRRIEIGSSPSATIPLSGDGLLPCHVLLRRDDEVFRLRNLSRAPITANGVTVAPRGRTCVVLPLDLALTENVKVALRVRTAVQADVVTHSEEDKSHVQHALEH